MEGQRKISRSNVSLKILIFFLLAEIISSTVVTDPLAIQSNFSSSSDSSHLKLEPRSEPEDSDEVNKIEIFSPSVRPVYSESRSTVDKSQNDSPSSKKIKSPTRDSYLDALDHSHSSQDPREGLVRVDPKYKGPKLIRRTYDGPVYRPVAQYGPPNDDGGSFKSPRIAYGVPATPEPFYPTPSNSYSLPVQQSGGFNQNPYGSAQNSYGAPQVSYGPAPAPQNFYGPPQNNYLPPGSAHQGFGGSSWSGYALPEIPQLPALPSIDFSWPFALKLNFFTIAKIILKLVIFKMIVKFIAIICLLLFIPKLEIKKGNKDDDSEDEQSRQLLAPGYTLEQFNGLTSMVLDSIESYERANGDLINDKNDCKTVNCRLRRFLKSGETWNGYVELFNNYVAEETNQITSENKSKLDT